MDIATIIAQAASVAKLAQLAIQAANDAVPFVKLLYQLLAEGKELTAEQRAFLKTQENALRAGLNEDRIPADRS